jgi:hypothetical protein
MLSRADVLSLQESYSFLKDAERDAVLRTAVDRFILGKKRGSHHPNKANRPNWDKIVDYVIAMETLFLTASDQPQDRELGYRFALNGSAIIARATGSNLPRTFRALKQLYALRSKVVHGAEESAVLKPANRFIREVQIERPDHQHPIGRLIIITKIMEEWIKEALVFVAKIPAGERPYRKADGWEEMLWYDHRDR